MRVFRRLGDKICQHVLQNRLMIFSLVYPGIFFTTNNEIRGTDFLWSKSEPLSDISELFPCYREIFFCERSSEVTMNFHSKAFFFFFSERKARVKITEIRLTNWKSNLIINQIWEGTGKKTTVSSPGLYYCIWNRIAIKQ